RGNDSWNLSSISRRQRPLALPFRYRCSTAPGTIWWSFTRWMDTTEAFVSVPASAKDELIGAWKLVSFVVEDVTTKERKLLYGEHPKGYFMFLPSGRAAVLITSENRKVPTRSRRTRPRSSR